MKYETTKKPKIEKDLEGKSLIEQGSIEEMILREEVKEFVQIKGLVSSSVSCIFLHWYGANAPI